MAKSIELEYGACITEADYLRLRDFLSKEGKTIGSDNKDTHFFIWLDKVVKVVFNKDSEKAKISLKPGRIGKQSHFDEIELLIDIGQAEKAVEFFKTMSPDDIQFVYQFRTNYEYKGVEIALKYTRSWGFHVELEIMLDSVEEKEKADLRIKKVASELGLEIMQDDELAEYTTKIDSGHNFGIYTKEDFPY